MARAADTRGKPGKSRKYMLVSFGRMNLLGFFEHHESKISKGCAQVVIKTDRGLQLGRLVGQLASYRGGQFKLSEAEVKEYFGDNNIEMPRGKGGKFIRYATAADLSEHEHLQRIAREEIKCCRRFVEEMNLPMKIVDAEHILGGERIIFFFMSDGRVDFRELVKKLAHEYQTRIEMRQIGARDEAKLLGDIESCGQECCCKRFLRALKPVNMRMAKMQKATLDPSKISGYCGRLKCCLRYEDKTYTELKKNLPKKNTWVKTKNGIGRVVDTQILTQLVVAEYDTGARIASPVDEIEVVPPPQRPEKGPDDAGDKRAGKDRRPRRDKRDGKDKRSQEVKETAKDKRGPRGKKRNNRDNRERNKKEVQGPDGPKAQQADDTGARGQDGTEPQEQDRRVVQEPDNRGGEEPDKREAQEQDSREGQE